MTRESVYGVPSAQPDDFRLGRVAALQPHLDCNAILQPMMQTADPLIVNNIANVVRMWAYDRQDVPNDFCELATIHSVSRQPIAFVVAEAECVSRSLVSSESPFSGNTFDAREWHTSDVFELAPLAELSFPYEETVHQLPISGQESLRPCNVCNGTGHCACQTCGALGYLICPTCGGTQQATCPTCEGAGTHIGRRGNFIQCQTCRTRGHVTCTRCTRGNLPCDSCDSSGETICQTCLGHRNLLRRWSLAISTSSWRAHQSYVPVDWRLPLDCLLDDCQDVASVVWSGTDAPALQDSLPGHFIPLADDQINTLMQQANRLDRSSERIAGMRLRLLGAYVYKVDLDYEGQHESIFLGGLHCQVFTHRGTDQKTKLRGFMRSFSRRFARPFDKPLVDRAYLTAVRAGKVHISDTRQVVPDAATRAGADFALSVDGYTLAVPARAHGQSELTPATVSVEWDVDETGQLLLCTTLIIGPATRRDMFPKLLGLNQELSFGRLAFYRHASLHITHLALVDRRLYETIKGSDYALILVAMASEALELQRHKAFR